MRKITNSWVWAVGLAVSFVSTSAWAGVGGGAPGGGGEGSGAPEPEVVALMLFSLIPGFFFARKAIAAQRESTESN